MNCPKCGEKFRVANTASTSDTSRIHLRNLVIDTLEWYSEDFVVRKEMFKIIAKEGLPDQMKKK